MRDTERHALIDQYGEGAQVLKAALATVPAAARQWRPQTGAWSVHEIVCHCADSETNSASRIRYLTAERDLTLDNYDQDRWAVDFDYHAHPFEAALAAVEAVRAKHAAADPSPSRPRVGARAPAQNQGSLHGHRLASHLRRPSPRARDTNCRQHHRLEAQQTSLTT